MMLIRHLAVLGALAALVMAHPSAANKSDSKSSKHMSKKPKSKPHTMAHSSTAKRSKGKGEKSKSKDDKSKSKGDKSKSKGNESKSKDEKSKSKGEKSKSKGDESKSGKSKKPHKDECPCFDEEDVDSFLRFVAGADGCSYYGYSSDYSTYLSVSVNYPFDDNVSASRSLSSDVYDDGIYASGSCSWNVYSYVSTTDSTTPVDAESSAKGSEKNSSSLMMPSETFLECQALIEDLKGPMKALGCSIYTYPCPYPCVNGDCTEDGCICYSGWTGDSCEECDESVCVNGVCTVSGCVCDENFVGPPCTECEYGWMGDNCDECDPSACVNGNCTDTGCVCKVGWTGPNCDYCDFRWTGENCDACAVGWTGNDCDTCDPFFCADGYCSSCMNGQCTGNGCDCDAGWYGDKCDRVYGDGCPCFNEEDVDDFLKFAVIAGADPSLGYCYYYEEGTNYLSLNVYFFSGPSYGLVVTDSQCSSFRTRDMSISITAEEAGECRDAIVNAEAKDQMAAFGCEISTYTDAGNPEPLINGK